MLDLNLSGLRAFEAAGRNGSLSAAGAELHLSVSAVSHAVRKLEASLGVSLFERDGRGVRLTVEGEALLRYASRAFEELRRGVEAVAAQGPMLLRLHSAPSFAAQWLAPRLAGFLKRHPNAEVRLSAGTDYARFPSDEFDADIVYGLPRQTGVEIVPMGEEAVTPLCAPALARRLRRPADLAHHVLIDSYNKRLRWSDWFQLNGLGAPPSQAMRFDRSFLAIAAAADGLGIALESTRLAERELAAGRLVRPLRKAARDLTYVGHYLVYPSPGRQRAALRAFVEWLGEELALAGERRP